MDFIILKRRLLIMNESVLIFDIETDGIDTTTANMKWFGAYSYKEKKYYLFDNKKNCQIKDLIKSHKVLVGFNNKHFDQPILERYGVDFNYKIIIDLYEISASKSGGEHTINNKNKLVQMGYKLKNYKLKTIIETLKLDNVNKGDINYNIFKKEEWNEDEIKEIKKYLKQDIILTKKLFEWYEEQFNPLKQLLPEEAQRKFVHIKSTLSSLGYQIICNKAGLEVEWNDKRPDNIKSYTGAHHIENRNDLIKGNIVSIDFISAYPHALMMYNLFSPSENGWDGKDYYKINGCYNNKQLGKIETALKYIFMERIKAKKNKDKPKNLSYKIIINSIYGLTGNYKFKSLYNPTTAGDCTSIVRTWLKKLAKTLEENGFDILYGFTDNIYVKIPEQLNQERLMNVVNKFINKIKNNTPFPMDSFGMELEKEIRMIWFASKNCYLYVTKNNKVEYKSTLLNVNTPKLIMDVFNNYMKPIIIKELNINFKKEELEEEIKKILKENVTQSSSEYNVNDLESYNVKTSLHYQISEKYGTGKHFLIPNLRGVGIGKSKTTKRKEGVRYCTLEEFNKNKLSYLDIDISKLIDHLKLFIINKTHQTSL